MPFVTPLPSGDVYERTLDLQLLDKIMCSVKAGNVFSSVQPLFELCELTTSQFTAANYLGKKILSLCAVS